MQILKIRLSLLNDTEEGLRVMEKVVFNSTRHFTFIYFPIVSTVVKTPFKENV